MLQTLNIDEITKLHNSALFSGFTSLEYEGDSPCIKLQARIQDFGQEGQWSFDLKEGGP